jgi:hypothetical protein
MSPYKDLEHSSLALSLKHHYWTQGHLLLYWNSQLDIQPGEHINGEIIISNAG